MRAPRETRVTSLRGLELAFVAAGLLLGSPRASAQPAAEQQEAVKREEKTAQDALPRAVAEFDGPNQGRSLVAFDEIIARLEAVGPPALT